MPIVADVHQHITPPGFVQRIREDAGRHGLTLRTSAGADYTGKEGQESEEIVAFDGTVYKLLPPRTDLQLRLEQTSEAGIDVSLQSVTPIMMLYSADQIQGQWISAAINDGMAESMASYPDRLISMATVPLQFPDMAADEIDRVVDQYDMRAVQVGTHVRDENLDAAELDPFWKAAERHGLLVFVHPFHPAAKSRLSNYYLKNLIGNPLEDSIAVASIIFGGVLERFPDLKLCFAHSGGYAPWIRGRWRHGMEVRPEARDRGAIRPFDEYFRALYFDTLIHDQAALQFLVDTVGSDHVLHGTDYPADMGDWHQLAWIEGLTGVSDEEKANIFGRNALRLVGRET